MIGAGFSGAMGRPKPVPSSVFDRLAGQEHRSDTTANAVPEVETRFPSKSDDYFEGLSACGQLLVTPVQTPDTFSRPRWGLSFDRVGYRA